ncbi:MAG: RNA-binding protein [Peptococcaceae bacterium]|nr:RNA-binding protein [Peptococcaceae bacterium]
MVRTLYVGNLPWTAKPDDLTSFFGNYGDVVSSRIITDRETGRSRGFGFVEVADADAERMVEALNGADMNGRPLTVNEAKPKQM